tara:strand:- start:972 stop:1457 length:486 start_codon:yes stop_codon:yes gene_type:complete
MIKKNIQKIKLVATDIDGVWTDAKMYYTENGDYMKAFSTYDGMAVKLLKESGLQTVILTSENTKIVLQRAKKLNIENVFINEQEKLKRMTYICNKLKISLDEVAYIGDDVNDLELLNVVGFSGVPINSPILNQFQPNFISKRVGGSGAFREFADVIIKNQQ